MATKAESPKRLARPPVRRLTIGRKYAIGAVTSALSLALAACLLAPTADAVEPTRSQAGQATSQILKPAEAAAAIGAPKQVASANAWHPPHRVKVWLTTHKGRTFRVTQLPRCEHVETLITHNPRGETLAGAKNRAGGFAACTGSFHHPRSMALADFVQKEGSILSAARTGRSFVAVQENGVMDISCDYALFKGKPGVSALALGQRLIPLQRDGFSVAFMNRVTDRMAIGVNDHFIFIVQGKSDIWRLAHFMKNKLPCKTAVNSDGGHVVRGKAPVHLVFRWKTNAPCSTMVAESKQKAGKQGGT